MIEETQIVLHKADQPGPIAHLPNADILTGEHGAEVDFAFRAALAARDIIPPERIIADGSGLENWRDCKGWQSWRVDNRARADAG